MWKGSIAFGLVNIPVELYSAVRDHRPNFRLLHAKDESPVHYERVCQREGKPVAWEDLVIRIRVRERAVRRADCQDLKERETSQGAEVVDLMERLRASLEGKRAGKGEAARRSQEDAPGGVTPGRPGHQTEECLPTVPGSNV